MLSAALFYKDVKDFIVQTRADEVFTIINSKLTGAFEEVD